MVLQELIWQSLRSIKDRQQLLTANLTGNAFFGFVLYSWLSLNHLSLTSVWRGVGVLLVLGFFFFWLQATTFAAFHPGSPQSPYFLALRRLPRFLPWSLAILGTVALYIWMSSVLGYFVWIVGVGMILAFLPLASQAAGGGFSRQRAVDIIFNEQYWLVGTGLLMIGLYLPVVMLALVPAPENPILRMMISGFRLGIAYFLAIGSWVALSAFIGKLGSLETNRKKSSATSPPRDANAPPPVNTEAKASLWTDSV